ncbi:MAG TPA: GTP 3',8-cyclase MoaA [Acidobacteriota bacterium]|nr:GTP 3',8-cyclase MoaA [Acidobacteriota bacterium]
MASKNYLKVSNLQYGRELPLVDTAGSVMQMQPGSGRLIDRHGRHIRKLRVSLLDACNFRCFYCMPMKTRFMPVAQLLTSGEIERICASLVRLGIERIRITGGEPTLRKDFDEIMSRLAKLPLDQFGVTSNGLRLKGHLEHLWSIGCHNLNFSLDSLQEERFERITFSKGFRRVLDTILAARSMGFNVKINTLLLKGRNDDEILDFVRFSAQEGIEVRFLELMKIGVASNGQQELFMSADEATGIISRRERLIPEEVELDSTSIAFRTESGARIGFIASESRPFCGHCSRLRLTADGQLRACLMAPSGFSIRGIPEEHLEEVVCQVIAQKPMERTVSTRNRMNQIGG